jgi:glycosyltransferase involved in cell wall biosynthesis
VTVGYHRAGELLPRYKEAGVRTISLDHYVPIRKTVISDSVGIARNLAKTLPLELDVVGANAYHSTFFGALLARVKRVPLVCHLRLNPPWRATSPTRVGLRYVSRFITVSASAKTLWTARGVDPNAIDVVHEGVDLNRFRPLDSRAIRDSLGIPGDAFVMLAPGRLDPVKNLEAVLRTFAQVLQSCPQSFLIVAGAPYGHESVEAGERYRSSLVELARNLGVEDRVKWVGQRSDMPHLYAASDIALLFSSIPEPFPLVTCEALACGRPIVTPRHGGPVDILTGEFSRFMFDPGKYAEAARIIASARTVAQLDTSFGQRARAHITQWFDIAQMGERMESALREAVRLGSRSRGPSLDSFKYSPSVPMA